MSFIQNKLFGVRIWEWGLLLLFYSFFGHAYQVTIYLTSQGQEDYFENMVLDYSLKALFTIPVWLLIFRVLSDRSFWEKMAVHLLVLPLYIIIWQQTYYLICGYLDMDHLKYPFAWWDIYIPGLFYVMQFGIFHVYDFYHKLKRQHKLEMELRQSALQSELTALKAQLNPHFLYNTFNTISASVPPGQEHTRELIAKLADMFRYQLKGSKEELIPLNEEVAFLKDYLELEKARFGNRLEYEFDISDSVFNAQIPPMILQPLVENAVKHGISPKIEGGKLIVRIFPKGKNIRFEIKDSGVGFNGHNQENNNGVGLTNTRKRLEKMYNAKLAITEPGDGGVIVSFEIPG